MRRGGCTQGARKECVLRFCGPPEGKGGAGPCTHLEIKLLVDLELGAEDVGHDHETYGAAVDLLHAVHAKEVRDQRLRVAFHVLVVLHSSTQRVHV